MVSIVLMMHSACFNCVYIGDLTTMLERNYNGGIFETIDQLVTMSNHMSQVDEQMKMKA
jgi:hypothetical protein